MSTPKVKTDEDAIEVSDVVPKLNSPSRKEMMPCLAFVPASVSVRVRYGVAEAICKDHHGEVVPIPTLAPPVASHVPPEVLKAVEEA